MLSDGRIVGRAEPFAKVFQSSRMVKQAVGMTAWGILEDIALDATLDVEGRLVAETSARRIAHNLGLNKETVTRHLSRLREYGFVLHEEVRHNGSGRYETARYVLDPSACLERFTTTPARQRARSGPCTEKPDTVKPDTVKPVHGEPGHGGTGHGGSVRQQEQDLAAVPEEQQQQALAEIAELVALGIDHDTAQSLAIRYSPTRIHDVARAAPLRASRNRAGWAIRALEGGWTVGEPPRPAPLPVPEWQPAPARDDAADATVEARWRGWDQAVSAALDDDELAAAVEASCAALAPAARIVPAVRARLIRWAAQASRLTAGGNFRQALLAALASDLSGTAGSEAADGDDELGCPPEADVLAPPLRHRLADVLAQSSSSATTEGVRSGATGSPPVEGRDR